MAISSPITSRGKRFRGIPPATEKSWLLAAGGANEGFLILLDADAKKVLRLLEQLEDNDDVQDVYANFDIPEQVLEAVAG